MKALTLCLILLTLVLSQTVYAQDYNRPLEVQGSYQDSTDQSTRLQQMRRRLEKRNETMVRKQIENIRYQNEMKLLKDTQKAMNKILIN